jgi:hypothetical protein
MGTEVELDGGHGYQEAYRSPDFVVEIDTVEDGCNFTANALRSRAGKSFSQEDLPSITLSISTRSMRCPWHIVDVIVAGTATKPEIKLQSQPQLTPADFYHSFSSVQHQQASLARDKGVQQQARRWRRGGRPGRSESLGLASGVV